MKIHDYVVANGRSHPTGMGGWGNTNGVITIISRVVFCVIRMASMAVVEVVVDRAVVNRAVWKWCDCVNSTDGICSSSTIDREE